MYRKNIVIFGGGTISHVRSHLALCAPAFGSTAKKIESLCQEIIPDLNTNVLLTRMAGVKLIWLLMMTLNDTPRR